MNMARMVLKMMGPNSPIMYSQLVSGWTATISIEAGRGGLFGSGGGIGGMMRIPFPRPRPCVLPFTGLELAVWLKMSDNASAKGLPTVTELDADRVFGGVLIVGAVD